MDTAREDRQAFENYAGLTNIRIYSDGTYADYTGNVQWHAWQKALEYERGRHHARITELEQMVRELVEEGDYLVKFAQTTSGQEGWQDTRTKALALLQPLAPS